MSARAVGLLLSLLSLADYVLPNESHARPRTATIDCFSNDGKLVYCPTHAIGEVKLVRQFSLERCRRYENWGSTGDGSGIWVKGCRGRFMIVRGRPAPKAKPTTVTCNPEEGGYTHCETPTWGHYVFVKKNLSEIECKRADNWGVDFTGIWVDRGCGAEFALQ